MAEMPNARAFANLTRLIYDNGRVDVFSAQGLKYLTGLVQQYQAALLGQLAPIFRLASMMSGKPSGHEAP
jgi:hypothetical protein